jgi:hypothetical protein
MVLWAQAFLQTPKGYIFSWFVLMILCIACGTIHLSWCNLQVSYKLSFEAIFWNVAALCGMSPFTIARRYLQQLIGSRKNLQMFQVCMRLFTIDIVTKLFDLYGRILTRVIFG